MKVRIEFNTDSAAFEDNLTLEIKEVLERAMLMTTGMVTCMNGRYPSDQDQGRLRDANGNTVGTVVVER